MNKKTSSYVVLPEITNRRSVRRFDPRPVEREKLISCLEAARIAPSAEHAQPWRFIILDESAVISRFGEAVFSGIYRNTRWAMKAPVLVILLADLNFIVHRVSPIVQPVHYYLLDLGIAGEHIVMQAQRMGLGSCWIGWFDFRRAKRFLGLDKRYRICDLLAIGYPDAEWKPSKTKRKSLDEIAFFNVWKGKSL